MNATAVALTPDQATTTGSRPGLQTIADPMPIASGLLGFQLVIYVARWIAVSPQSLAESVLTAANDTSLLIAGAAQVGAGLLCLLRGNAYVGYIATTFGMWLLGFYMLAKGHEVDPDSFAWFIGALIVPLVLLMIPAALHRRWAFTLAFGAILVMLIIDAIAFHILHGRIVDAVATKTAPDLSSTITLLHASAWAAGVAAIAVFWLAARGIFEATGLARPTEHIG